jgi:hypothetical protein
MVHPNNGMLFSINKKNEQWSHERTQRNIKFILVSKRSHAERVHSVLTKLWHSKTSDTIGTVQTSVIARSKGEEKDYQVHSREFWGQLKYSYVTMMMKCHYIFVLNCRVFNKGEPMCKAYHIEWYWFINMC